MPEYAQMSRDVLSAPRTTWGRVVARFESNASLHHPLILASWQRCRDGGVDPAGEVRLRRVPIEEMLSRQAASRSLLLAAADLIDAFSTLMGSVKHVIYMTDADGIVLYSRGTDFMMQSYGLRPGFDWSEAAMGTNGAGTAIACNAPVAVLGPDHWMLPFRDASCLGAPIHNGAGAPIGAIDLSTSAADCDPRHLDGVVALAAAIETRLSNSAAHRR